MVSTSTGSDPRRRDSRFSASARRLNRCHAVEDEVALLPAPAPLPELVASSDRMGLRISAPPDDRRLRIFFALRRLLLKLFRITTLFELSHGTDPRRCMLYAGPMLFGSTVAVTSGWAPFGWSFVCMEVMNSAGIEPRRKSHVLMTNDTLRSDSTGFGGKATVTGAEPLRRLRLRFSIDGSRFSFWPRESFGIFAFSPEVDESVSRLVLSFLVIRMPRDSLFASGWELEELLLELDSRRASGQAPSSACEDM